MKDIYSILSSIPVSNLHYLQRYVRFVRACLESNRINPPEKTEDHHICPKAKDMFPEFKDLKKHPWNKAPLSHRQHFIAHIMLWKSYKTASTTSAVLFMNKDNDLNSKLYEKLRLRISDFVSVKDLIGGDCRFVSKKDPRFLSGELVGVTKGLFPAKDADGNIELISKEDPRFLSGELVGVLSGFVTVKDSDGNTMSVPTDDLRYLSGELKPASTGFVVVKDQEGNRFSVPKDDPRYLSGEFVGITTGLISAKDGFGNTHMVKSDDPRYLSGELKGVLSNRVTVEDKAGNTLSVSKDDPRYISGEFEFHAKGFQHINNGIRNKAISQNSEIPEGWTKGLLPRKNLGISSKNMVICVNVQTKNFALIQKEEYFANKETIYLSVVSKLGRKFIIENGIKPKSRSSYRKRT